MLTKSLNIEKNYNPGQKCWEGSVTFEITPLPPLSMLDFAPNKMVTFLPTLNMGEGGPQEHALSQIVQSKVRIIELSVK